MSFSQCSVRRFVSQTANDFLNPKISYDRAPGKCNK